MTSDATIKLWAQGCDHRRKTGSNCVGAERFGVVFLGDCMALTGSSVLALTFIENGPCLDISVGGQQHFCTTWSRINTTSQTQLEAF